MTPANPGFIPSTSPTAGGPADSADLDRLAGGLAQRGYPATLLTMLPVLAVSHLGSLMPPRILIAGDTYYWATAEPISARADPGHAADIIAWTLHARPRA
jgi:hypothetical protein